MPPFDTGGRRWQDGATLSTRTENRFASVVRGRLLDNKLNGRKPDSIRGLAKQMAKGDPVKAATYKRALFKWMAPGDPQPTPASRAVVADALGLERSALSDDDEESEPMSDNDILVALRPLARLLTGAGQR